MKFNEEHFWKAFIVLTTVVAVVFWIGILSFIFVAETGLSIIYPILFILIFLAICLVVGFYGGYQNDKND